MAGGDKLMFDFKQLAMEELGELTSSTAGLTRAAALVDEHWFEFNKLVSGANFHRFGPSFLSKIPGSSLAKQ